MGFNQTPTILRTTSFLFLFSLSGCYSTNPVNGDDQDTDTRLIDTENNGPVYSPPKDGTQPPVTDGNEDIAEADPTLSTAPTDDNDISTTGPSAPKEPDSQTAGKPVNSQGTPTHETPSETGGYGLPSTDTETDAETAYPSDTVLNTERGVPTDTSESLPRHLTQEECHLIEGAYNITSYCSEVWVAITPTEDECKVTVTPPWSPPFAYLPMYIENAGDLGHAITLEPVGENATETWWYHEYWNGRVLWFEFLLGIDANGLTQEGTTGCEGLAVIDGYFYSLDTDMYNATVAMDEENGSLQITEEHIMPWSTFEVTASRTARTIVSGLESSDDIFAFEPEPTGADALHSVNVTLKQDWDTTRGNTYALTPQSDLVDIKEKPFDQTPLNITVADIGPATDATFFSHLDDLYVVGNVEIVITAAVDGGETEGYANLMSTSCYETAGIAGQLTTHGNGEVVITFVNEAPVPEPGLLEISVVGENGAPLPGLQTGSEHTTWIYDASGQERVGFWFWSRGWCNNGTEKGFAIDAITTR